MSELRGSCVSVLEQILSLLSFSCDMYSTSAPNARCSLVVMTIGVHMNVKEGRLLLLWLLVTVEL